MIFVGGVYLGLLARLHFADANYSEEVVELNSTNFDDAFNEVADMIHKSTIVNVDTEKEFFSVVYTRSINMAFIVKFEIFKKS